MITEETVVGGIPVTVSRLSGERTERQGPRGIELFHKAVSQTLARVEQSSEKATFSRIHVIERVTGYLVLAIGSIVRIQFISDTWENLLEITI